MKTERFASMMRFLIQSGHYRLTDLAKKTNYHLSDLSKIVNSKRVCSAKVMEVIVGAMLAQHQPQAVVAWLVDQIPDNFRHMVHVVKAASAKSNEPVDVNTLEGALAVLATHAEANPAVRKLVLTMAGVMAGGDGWG